MNMLIMIFAILAAATGTQDVLFDMSWVHFDNPRYGENIYFEDGSWIRTSDDWTFSGCDPFQLCSTIGIDTPWEDIFTNQADVEFAYWVVGMYKAQYQEHGNDPWEFRDYATHIRDVLSIFNIVDWRMSD